ncbi:alpha/beta fold hydrolase [Gordonia sp. OPL2]|uniref:alpha/beta fold hydrolase n=1 Tax=Gordonia sp. OPL2 TaxID=2486274 RepID=UPI0016556BEF|nr:hydrolase [Gordonia sp. OPL2]ROZ98095.1 hydrolase [Gordonia sp. OPL2]
MIAARLWWGDGARAAVVAGEPTHVFADGADVVDAIRLAVDHPDTVLSLVLAEPVTVPDDIRATLAQVTVPTLVLASAPVADADLSAAQLLAGDIDNGVFVVIDGAPRPVHTERRESFAEWTSSFVAIAEGLAARDGRLLTPPTPLVEGALR